MHSTYTRSGRRPGAPTDARRTADSADARDMLLVQPPRAARTAWEQPASSMSAPMATAARAAAIGALASEGRGQPSFRAAVATSCSSSASSSSEITP